MREISPAVIVHCLNDLRFALNITHNVTILSAPGAACYAGCLWWQQLLLQAEFTGVALLDCADAPGRALEALKLRLNGLVLQCGPAAFNVVAEIALMQGAVLLPAAPSALDLGSYGAKRQLERWLAG